MLRLRYALLREEEMNNTEDELNDTLQFKSEMKVCLPVSLTLFSRAECKVSDCASFPPGSIQNVDRSYKTRGRL